MDRYPARPILWAAAGIFGMILFLMVAIGAAGLGFAFTVGAPHAFGASIGTAAGCYVVAALFLWFAYLALRGTVRRLKEANAEAVARRNALGL